MPSRVSVVHLLLAWYVLWWTLLAIAPVDRQDWALENILAVVLVGTLIATHRRFRFSSLSYLLITLFMTLHAVGAHYTYAEVPLGFWLKDALSLSRNPFDRIVHFAFGFLLVYPLKELLIRTVRVKGFWSLYLPISGILAQSGFFELVEALVAQIVNPDLGAAYLGTQGDEWDAQKDMAAAFVGSVLAALIMWPLARNVRRLGTSPVG
jgi:putative membrane protein